MKGIISTKLEVLNWRLSNSSCNEFGFFVELLLEGHFGIIQEFFLSEKMIILDKDEVRLIFI